VQGYVRLEGVREKSQLETHKLKDNKQHTPSDQGESASSSENRDKFSMNVTARKQRVCAHGREKERERERASLNIATKGEVEGTVAG